VRAKRVLAVLDKKDGSLELKKMAVLEKDCHFRLKEYLL
jgi:hypothetical protein